VTAAAQSRLRARAVTASYEDSRVHDYLASSILARFAVYSYRRPDPRDSHLNCRQRPFGQPSFREKPGIRRSKVSGAFALPSRQVDVGFNWHSQSQTKPLLLQPRPARLTTHPTRLHASFIRHLHSKIEAKKVGAEDMTMIATNCPIQLHSLRATTLRIWSPGQLHQFGISISKRIR
jgi:hypothetical protein